MFADSLQETESQQKWRDVEDTLTSQKYDVKPKAEHPAFLDTVFTAPTDHTVLENTLRFFSARLALNRHDQIEVVEYRRPAAPAFKFRPPFEEEFVAQASSISDLGGIVEWHTTKRYPIVEARQDSSLKIDHASLPQGFSLLAI